MTNTPHQVDWVAELELAQLQGYIQNYATTDELEALAMACEVELRTRIGEDE
jgi:hypothetical protein